MCFELLQNHTHIIVILIDDRFQPGDAVGDRVQNRRTLGLRPQRAHGEM